MGYMGITRSRERRSGGPKQVFRGILGIMLSVLLVVGIFPASSISEVNAENYGYVSVTVTQLYDYAYEVLDYVNQERVANGLNELTMDAELMDAAMQRAAESVVNGLAYSNEEFQQDEELAHTRPNGETCFTVSSRSYGENVAMGINTPFAVMFGRNRNINPNSSADMDHSAWMRSDGHRSNILTKGYKSVGIGAVYYGGSYYYYWSQEFGYSEGVDPGRRSDRVDKTFSVVVSSDVYNRLSANNAISGSTIGQYEGSSGGSSGSGGDDGRGTSTSYPNGWVNDGAGWKYAYNGYFVKNTWINTRSGKWYAIDAHEYMITGWRMLEGNYYYFAPDGVMASDEWRDGYWLSSSGAWTYEAYGSWHLDGNGWWFGDTSGWYAANQWQKINGSWYYFDGSGYMVTNKYIDGYYLGADGVMW